MRNLPLATEGQLVQRGRKRQMAFTQVAKLPRLTIFEMESLGAVNVVVK